MKKAILLLPLFLFSHTSNAASFYEHSDLGGDSVQYFPGQSIDSISRNAGIEWHDEISSVKVEYNECVILYRDKGFEGTIHFFGPGTYNLSSYSFNDEASSLHVTNTTACNNSDLTFFYKHYDFSGPRFSLPVGAIISDLDYDQFNGNRHWNDELTSLIPGNNACVILGQHKGFDGTNKRFVNNVKTLSSHSFNDATSSIRIIPASQCTNTDDNTGGGTGGGGTGGGVGTVLQ